MPPQDAGTIEHFHNTLRALPRPLLESLTRAFRKRFQVPEEAVTIADRINQKCHHVWTRAFLVSHRECALQTAPGGALCRTAPGQQRLSLRGLVTG